MHWRLAQALSASLPSRPHHHTTHTPNTSPQPAQPQHGHPHDRGATTPHPPPNDFVGTDCGFPCVQIVGFFLSASASRFWAG